MRLATKGLDKSTQGKSPSKRFDDAVQIKHNNNVPEKIG
jgi:hypothetical protein